MNKIMEIKIPDFMTKDFFQEILKSHCIPPIQDLNILMGSNVGENYFSKIYRVVIAFKEIQQIDKLSLIVKYLPIEGRRPFGENLKIYPKEIKMYFEVLPQLKKILKNEIFLAPKCLATTPDPTKTIVLQDLKSLGYTLPNRLVGLDEGQAKCVMENIAKFHAASMVMTKENPEEMKSFDHGFLTEINRDTTLQKNIFEGNLECMAEVLDIWDSSYQDLAKKLRNLKNIFLEKCLKNVKTNEKEIRVLNHGDLHLNNLMLKYDEKNQPIDVAFMDFQLSYYASLGLDINYFLNTSIQLDVLKSKRYELIRYYYDFLKQTLYLLDYSPIPSWDDVRKEILNKEFYGFFAFEGIFPTLIMRDCRFNNIDQYSADEILSKRRKVMFSNERLIETMKYSLDRFDELGILDI